MMQPTLDGLARDGPAGRQEGSHGRRRKPREVRLCEHARAGAAAEAANRAKDEFLAMLSHEMRSPLAAIAIWVDLIRRAKLTPEREAHAITAIERNVAILSRFTEEILDLSRVVLGKLALDVHSVDLAAVVDAALDGVHAAADAKAIHLQTQIDVPDPLAGDPMRLQQVVTNLLANAIKFSERGGVVVLRVATERSNVVISVRDTGKGIPTHLLPHVFERFRQVHETSARVHGGLGLGLALVQEIVALHHGTVNAESAGPGWGSTFTVTLPLAPMPGWKGLPPRQGGGRGVSELVDAKSPMLRTGCASS